MRSLGLSGLALLAACGAPEVQSQRLKDGSWSFTCELPMDECVRRAQEKCYLQRYRITKGSSETRLRDAPPFERAYHTSHLNFVCTDDGQNPLVTFGGDGKSVDPNTNGSSKPAVAGQVCTKGETRACVGAAACRGGQTCLPDGSGFTACDCGPVAPAAPVVESAPATRAAASSATEPAAPPAPKP